MMNFGDHLCGDSSAVVSDETDFSLLNLDAPALGRRTLMRFGIAAAAATVALRPLDLLAAPLAPNIRALPLMNLHTGEKMTIEYWQKGRYLKSGLAAINHLLRDHMNGKVYSIDPRLLDLSFLLHRTLNAKHPFAVVCGYRSPETNAWLRRNTDGVAANSYHMKGQAVDLRLPGVSTAVLHTVATRLHRGGVGYYPDSDFVHIDVGPVRTW